MAANNEEKKGDEPKKPGAKSGAKKSGAKKPAAGSKKSAVKKPAPGAAPANGGQPAPEETLTAGERVFLDLHRARRALGPGFARNDPKAWFLMRRAKVNAIVAVGEALRGQDKPASAAAADDAASSES